MKHKIVLQWAHKCCGSFTSHRYVQQTSHLLLLFNVAWCEAHIRSSMSSTTAVDPPPPTTNLQQTTFSFCSSRPPGVKHEAFLNELNKRYASQSSSTKEGAPTAPTFRQIRHSEPASLPYTPPLITTPEAHTAHLSTPHAHRPSPQPSPPISPVICTHRAHTPTQIPSRTRAGRVPVPLSAICSQQWAAHASTHPLYKYVILK